MSEKYSDTNLNYYIRIKLTEKGKEIYQKYYADFNCKAPSLKIDDEGYVKFQIHDFMNIFGERLFMGAMLPCETNCKIQVKDEWHYPSKGEYPEKGKEILLYTKTLGLIFGEFCKGYNNLWTSNRCDFTTEEIIAWIEKEKILPKGE